MVWWCVMMELTNRELQQSILVTQEAIMELGNNLHKHQQLIAILHKEVGALQEKVVMIEELLCTNGKGDDV